MKNKTTFSRFILVVVVVFLSAFQPAKNSHAQGDHTILSMGPEVAYHNIRLRTVETSDLSNASNHYEMADLKPLSIIEKNIADNLESHWTWPEYTLDMIDSYSPFLFRTKKSREYEEVKVLLLINSSGKLSGYEMMTEVDKGLKERLDYLIRKLPELKPVPGFDSYRSEAFELTIRK
ncbi:MAG: hypothetical protein HWE15_14080 [Algoriphagus sp.]|uniref:hypothetical protein n=1 Tax=Algoriphagus sp. TaxID=1872435 RepID=UPI0017EE4FA4|nr:hypothetical protein [Algoriphagus sp.]NVJ87433.1 hypothetical protein [Algoriphagus sp.]